MLKIYLLLLELLVYTVYNNVDNLYILIYNFQVFSIIISPYNRVLLNNNKRNIKLKAIPFKNSAITLLFVSISTLL